MLVRALVSLVVALSFVAVSADSQAAPKAIYGSLIYINPDVGGVNRTERGPFKFAGTANTAPAPGGDIALAQSEIQPMSGMQFRLFPAFPNVAQQTFTFYSTQLAVTFKAGSGAVGANGGDISFCPAASNMGPGNLACTNFQAPGAGNLAIRMGVNNAPAAPKYGGTLKVIRNSINSYVWFVPILPTSMNPVAQVSAQPNGIPHVTWTPGATNFRFIVDVNDPGKNYTAILGPSGSVKTLGNFVSTPPASDPRFLDGEAWAFQMTTGTISGSDIFPATQGTPMHFFFTRAGTDMRVATGGGALNGNIVLVGGAIASSPASGNLFDRVATLNVTVPEPGVALGLCAGLVGVIGLAVARRRSA